MELFLKTNQSKAYTSLLAVLVMKNCNVNQIVVNSDIFSYFL